MNINATSPCFKGGICIHEQYSRIVPRLDTDKISKIEARGKNSTLIVYDEPGIERHNGYVYETPTTFNIPVNVNTVLNAYAAAKNSNLDVDLSEYAKA